MKCGVFCGDAVGPLDVSFCRHAPASSLNSDRAVFATMNNPISHGGAVYGNLQAFC